MLAIVLLKVKVFPQDGIDQAYTRVDHKKHASRSSCGASRKATDSRTRSH